MNILMLAAGLGTRLRPLTNFVPKPCVPFLNVPLGLWNFRFTKHLPVTKLVVNTFHLPAQIVELYTKQNYYTGPLAFSHESGQILGSAGGLKKAENLFSDDDDTILMLNADEILFEVSEDYLLQAYQKHKANKNLATLVTMTHPDAGTKFGAIWCEGDRVKNIGKTRLSEAHVPQHYIGMIFLNRSLLTEIPENKEVNIFYDLLVQKLSTHKVEIFNINCKWYETGNFEDYFNAVKNVIPQINSELHAFISIYDSSVVVPSKGGLALVSKEILATSNLQFSGFSSVAKTTNPKLLETSGFIHDSILFSNYKLNSEFFKT